MDRTTKILLAAIALGLWANAGVSALRPAAAQLGGIPSSHLSHYDGVGKAPERPDGTRSTAEISNERKLDGRRIIRNAPTMSFLSASIRANSCIRT